MGNTSYKLSDRGREIADWSIDWICIDCGTNTVPSVDMVEFERSGAFTLDDRCEVYWVRPYVWQLAGNPKGSLCIGCLEARIGRRTKPKDFPRYDPHLQNIDAALNDPSSACTPRLRSRRGK